LTTFSGIGKRRASGASRFSGEFYWTGPGSVEALRQTILDTRTLLRWLREQDPGRWG
jgi:hypothetical protein